MTIRVKCSNHPERDAVLEVVLVDLPRIPRPGRRRFLCAEDRDALELWWYGRQVAAPVVEELRARRVADPLARVEEVPGRGADELESSPALVGYSGPSGRLLDELAARSALVARQGPAHRALGIIDPEAGEGY